MASPTPRDVLAKNFGVPEAAFAHIPIDVEHERYIFSGQVPGPLADDTVRSAAGRPSYRSERYAHRDTRRAPQPLYDARQASKEGHDDCGGHAR